MRRLLPGFAVAVALIATTGLAADHSRSFTPAPSRPAVEVERAASPTPTAVSPEETYTGTLRLYLVEPVGRWLDDLNYVYFQGFLDFPLVEVLNLPDGESIYRTVTWDAKPTEFGWIVPGNIQVIAVLFEAESHVKDAYPPNGYYFNAHYVDACAYANPGEPGTHEVSQAGFTHRVFVEEGTRTT